LYQYTVEGSLREVHPETFIATVSPLSNETHFYLFYSANNANGTSNYITFTALPDATAGGPNIFNVTLQVPTTDVFSEQIAFISIYTPVQPSAARSIDAIPLSVMVGLSGISAAGATGQPFGSVFTGFNELQVQQALLTNDQANLNAFIQDNIASFSPLISGGPGSPSTAESDLVEFSNGKAGGTAMVAAVPEPSAISFIVVAAGLLGGISLRRRRSAF